MTDKLNRVNTLTEAMNKLREEFLDGISYGFFEFIVSGEIIKDHKRKVIIKSGKKHQFVIPKEDLSK
jgi:endonuclease V-like protein UPF0215 family